MSDDNKRIIDYDAFNELPPNSWLVVDSEGQGTGKIAPIKIGATYEIQDGAHSFTLVGSNGYTHTVDIPYDSVQMSYSDYDALTELEKMDGTNRFVPDCPTTELEPEIWQRVGRDPLTTDEKTVSKAINELDSRSKAVNGDAFSELVEYSKGDYCIYDNAMYTYIADTPSTGSWDALKWELTDIQTEFSSIKSNLTEYAEITDSFITNINTNVCEVSSVVQKIKGIPICRVKLTLKPKASNTVVIGRINSNYKYYRNNTLYRYTIPLIQDSDGSSTGSLYLNDDVGDSYIYKVTANVTYYADFFMILNENINV